MDMAYRKSRTENMKYLLLDPIIANTIVVHFLRWSSSKGFYIFKMTTTWQQDRITAHSSNAKGTSNEKSIVSKTGNASYLCLSFYRRLEDESKKGTG